MENETELLDSQNEQDSSTEIIEEQTSVSDTQTEDVDIAELKQRNRELFARAKRAEGFELVDGKWVKKQKPIKIETKEKEEPKSSNYSLQDIRALGKVHDEDVERVEKFAKAEGLSIAEALKSEDLQAILERREQLRKTAEATNTGGSKRKSSPTTAEQIVSAAMEGKEVDPVKFAEAQMELRKKKK